MAMRGDRGSVLICRQLSRTKRRHFESQIPSNTPHLPLSSWGRDPPLNLPWGAQGELRPPMGFPLLLGHYGEEGRICSTKASLLAARLWAAKAAFWGRQAWTQETCAVPWGEWLSALSISFLICKMGIMTPYQGIMMTGNTCDVGPQSAKKMIASITVTSLLLT